MAYLNSATKSPRVTSVGKDRKIHENSVALQLEWLRKIIIKQNITSTLMNVETKIWNTMTPIWLSLRYELWVVSPQRNTSLAKATILWIGLSGWKGQFSVLFSFKLHHLMKAFQNRKFSSQLVSYWCLTGVLTGVLLVFYWCSIPIYRTTQKHHLLVLVNA